MKIRLNGSALDAPTLTIEALDQDISYGSDSVAEFLITRTGRHLPTLPFRLGSRDTGEVGDDAVWSRFAAGASTLTLKHFAIDKDEHNDPICEIIFVLQPGDGYVVGTPADASVTVTGPAPTCMVGMQVEAEDLTAEFEDLPTAHDGASPFSFRIAFSDAVTLSADDMRDHALTPPRTARRRRAPTTRRRAAR